MKVGDYVLLPYRAKAVTWRWPKGQVARKDAADAILIPARVVKVKQLRVIVKTIADMYRNEIREIPRTPDGYIVSVANREEVQFLERGSLFSVRRKQVFKGPEAVAKLVEMRILGQL